MKKIISRWRRVAFVLRLASALVSPTMLVAPAHAAEAAKVVGSAPVRIAERADWGKFFAAENVKGTIVVLDGKTQTYQAFDAARAERRVSPASTYKIFNSLLALESGALDNEREMIPWDGKPRRVKAWSAVMDLRTAFRVSCLPCYQVVSHRIPREYALAKLAAVGYGNHTIGRAADAYWIDDSLQISAREQVDFLQRLARGTLPFSARTQDIVRQISIVEANADYVLHGKTGWFVDKKPDIGWWVGWLERDGNLTMIAMNIDMGGDADAPKRARIVRNVLKDMKLI
ncbi:MULTISPECIES: OXA-62 family carbapenem-hydrolyzing class D beta-lactamase [Pandoraea]|uniref:OXA-62 family carbapenem-hydrolyzing class D beta-lactamase n=1 Tax=Pandoraea TaxID=93217 RepID=UPI001F5C602C|nr:MULTISPECIES: OXA-62 family carbapenem-hydrolyzing class D beta-lactamase [Pandoraea]MCI3205185.1 OXA-62 family carbapenem-hydrolyzing class D beta-lactamase [Pandoraea sp. LA3]MDN4583213.1 OXA-62 family carbapenem-hydrolyzing class D beta-lactamase [Pandoraea capi]